MHWTAILILLAAAGIVMILELRGVRTTLTLKVKGDIKRESAFLQQWGQLVCTIIVACMVFSFERDKPLWTVAVVTSVVSASVVCWVLKRLCGRIRPNREYAGVFLGPSLRHANWRESFPSSHSACAVALSASLALLFPGGAIVFWGLGIVCALLRYLLDAHFPSDVLAGIALGYACAAGTMQAFGV